MRAYKISNTTIQLEFDSEEQREALAGHLSYEVPGYKNTTAWKAGKWNGLKSFLTPANRIKIGLFKSLFPEHSLVYDKSFKDLTFDEIPLYKTLPNMERRQYQLDSINAILKHKRGLLSCIMGSGKTLCAAATCSYHLSLNKNNKVLFIVYDRNILKQTIDNFTKYGFKVSQFGDGIKDLSGDVVVGTIQSLNKLQNPKVSLKSISFVFADESHHAGANTSRAILSKIPKCEYIIGLTATPLVKRSIKTAELTAVIGPVIFSYGFSEAIRDKKVVPVKAFFLDINPDWDIKEKIFCRKNYKVIWDTAIRDNIKRNDLIADILSNIIELLKTPSLILIDRVEHGVSLNESLKKKSIIKAVAMYGQDDILMRENKKKLLMDDNINVLMSSVISEGIDFKISPVVAMNASGRKSFIKLIQFLGRITRHNDKFKDFRVLIDFVDKEHPYLKYHSEERIKACEEFGVEVVVCKSMKELMTGVIAHYKHCMK